MGGGERRASARAQERLKLGRFDEAMDIACEIEPRLYEANHLMQSASLLRHADKRSEKNKKAKTKLA